MRKRCKVCQSIHREWIDAAIMAGRSFKSVEREAKLRGFNVSDRSLCSHAHEHIEDYQNRGRVALEIVELLPIVSDENRYAFEKRIRNRLAKLIDKQIAVIEAKQERSPYIDNEVKTFEKLWAIYSQIPQVGIVDIAEIVESAPFTTSGNAAA